MNLKCLFTYLYQLYYQTNCNHSFQIYQNYIKLVKLQQLYNTILIPEFSPETKEYHCYQKGCQFLAIIDDQQYLIKHEHTCQQIKNPIINDQSKIKDDQLILLPFSQSENVPFKCKKDQQIQNRFGVFKSEQFKNIGEKTYNTNNQKFVYNLRYTPELYTANLQRLTQVIYSPDISLILERANIQPYYNIVEAGIGSGSLSMNFLNIIKYGKLYNFDLFQNRVDAAKEQFELHGYSDRVISQQADVYKDGFKNVPDKSINLVFLDLPEPEKCIKEISRVLIPGSQLITYLPCLEQVHRFISTIYQVENQPFYNIQTSKQHYIPYTTENVIASQSSLVYGKEIIDDYRQIVARRAIQERTHTGYLVFVNINYYVQQMQQQEEKQGCAGQQLCPVVNINGCLLILCGILNIIMPGLGCMIQACIDNDQLTFMNIFMLGLTEFMLSFILIGIIWSWIHACFFFAFGFKQLCQKKPTQQQEQDDQGYQQYQMNGYTLNNKPQVKENQPKYNKGHIL